MKEQTPSEAVDRSTLFLFTLIAAASAHIYLKLSHEPGFRPDLYYDLKHLEIGIFAFMGILTAVVALFHHWVIVKILEGGFLRGVSAIVCGGLYFIAFHIVFLLCGGMAHLQVNAVAHHCAAATYQERECLQARSRLNGLSVRNREILVKTASIYGKNRGKNASQADLALFQLIVNRGGTSQLVAQPLDQKK